MLRHTNVDQLIASVLVTLMVTFTIPVSAAELGAGAAPVGSIRVVGNVNLRGTPIPREGTIFDGDRISSRAGSNGTVALTNGNRFEFGSNTDVVVRQDGDVIQLAMNAGSIAFTSTSESLRISLEPYEFEPGPTATGVIGLMGPDSVGVVSTKGSMMVRNTSTKESFLLTEGQEVWMGRNNGVVADPISVIAANFPGRALPPVPSSPPPVPQGSSLSGTVWTAIVAAVAGGAAATTWALLARDKVDKSTLDAANASLTTVGAALTTANATITSLNSDKTALNASITTKNASIASLGTQITALGNTNSGLTQQLVNVQNAAVVELAATQARLRAIEVELASERTKTAIAASALTAAQKSTFTAQAEVIVTQVKAKKAEIAVLETEMGTVKDKLALLGFTIPSGATSALTSGDFPASVVTARKASMSAAQQTRFDNALARLQDGAPHLIDFTELGDLGLSGVNSADQVEALVLLVEGDAITHDINKAVVAVNSYQTDFNSLLTELQSNNVVLSAEVKSFESLSSPTLKPVPTASLSMPL